MAIKRGTPHWYILSVGPTAITERPEKSTRLPSKFWRKRPCLPLSMWLKDLSGRLPGPVIGRPRRPLSIRASTASCNIRFSFCTMIPGAFNSSKRAKRLLRLITRR